MAANSSESSSAQSDPEPPSASVKESGKNGGCGKKLLVILLVLLGLGWAVNGPVARVAGKHFLKKALTAQGMEGDVEIEGSLGSGFSLKNAKFTGEQGIGKIQFQELSLRYGVTDLIGRKIDELKASGVELELDLAKFEKKEKEEPKEAFDLEQFRKTLNSVRETYEAADVDLKDVSIKVKNEGERVVDLHFAQFANPEGADESQLKGLKIEGLGGQDLAAQDVLLTWTAEKMTLDRLEALPGVAVSNLEFSTEPGSELGAGGTLEVFGGKMTVEAPTMKDLDLKMVAGRVDLSEINRFLPSDAARIGGRVTDLSADLVNLRGDLALELRDLVYGEIALEGVNVTGNLDYDRAELFATLTQGGELATLQARLPVDHAETFEELEGRPLDFSVSVPNLAKVSSYAGTALPSGQLEVRGSYQFLTSDFGTTIDYEGGTLMGKPVPAFGGSVGLEEKLLTVDLAGSGNGEGNGDADKEALLVKGTYDLTKRNYSVAVDGPLPVDPWVSQVNFVEPLTVDLSGTGNVERNEHDLSGTVRTAAEVREQIITAEGDLSLQGQLLEFDLLTDAEGQQLRLEGSYGLASSSYGIEAKGIAPVEPWLPAETVQFLEPLQIDLSGKGNVKEQKHDLSGTVQTVLEVRGQSIRANGDVELKDDLAIANLQTVTEGKELLVEGTYNVSSTDYTAKLDGVAPVGPWLPESIVLEEALQVDLSGEGNVREKDHKVSGDIDTAVRVQGQVIEAQGEVAVIGDEVRVDLRTQTGSDALKIAGTYQLRESEFTYAIEGNAPVRPFLPAGLSLQEPLRVDLSGGGNVQEQVYRSRGEVVTTLGVNGQAVAIDAKVDADWPEKIGLPQVRVQTAQGDLSGALQWQEDRLRIGGLNFSDASGELLVVDGSAPLPMNLRGAEQLLEIKEEIQLRVEAKDFNFARYPALFPGVTGRIDGQMALTGTYARPELNGQFRGEDLRIDQLSKLRPISFNLLTETNGQFLDLRGTVSEGEEGVAVIDGRFPLAVTDWVRQRKSFNQTPVKASVRVEDFSLQRLEALVPALREVRGRAQVDLNVGGTVAEPTFVGDLLVQAQRVRFENESLPDLRDSRLAVRFDRDKITIEKSRFLGSGGVFELGGTVQLDGTVPRIDLSLRAVRALVWRDDALSLRTDANLGLKGTLEQATLSGTLGLSESLYFKDFELIPFGVPAKSVPEPQLPSGPSVASTNKIPIPAPYANWRLDITLTTADPVLVRGNLAEGKVTGLGTIQGRLGEPQVTLDVELKDASLELPLSQLEIEAGTATLRPGSGWIPNLNIRGKSKVGSYQVFVYVYGKATSPKLVFTSTPPLPEAEVLTLLATGTTTSGLEDQQVASVKAFQLLLSELRRKFAADGNEGPVAQALSALDTVDLRVGDSDPFSGRRFNSATLQLSSKFYVSASVDGEGNSRGIVIYALRF